TYSTIFTGTASLIFYVGMTIISYNILQDTIESTSLAVAMYYAITSFACIWYFRKNLFDTGRNFVMRFLLPLIGGIMMRSEERRVGKECRVGWWTEQYEKHGE